jgi:hypothetical protein
MALGMANKTPLKFHPVQAGRIDRTEGLRWKNVHKNDGALVGSRV